MSCFFPEIRDSPIFFHGFLLKKPGSDDNQDHEQLIENLQQHMESIFLHIIVSVEHVLLGQISRAVVLASSLSG